MSSMRNAVQRRNHKERAQPLERQKWGILEKHKDYSLRAKDHNAKKRKIKTLKEKASERNEDEFYFGMMSNTSAGGIKRAKRGEENSGGGGRVLPEAVVKLMKTQDAGYLRTVLQQTKKERERVGREVVAGETGVIVAPAGEGNRRLVFGDNGQAAPALSTPPAESDEEIDLDQLMALDDFDPYAPLDDIEDHSDNDESEQKSEAPSKEKRAAAKKKRHTLQVRQRYLEALRTREEDLERALQEVEHQRARMNGSVGGMNKAGVKFKLRQRKR